MPKTFTIEVQPAPGENPDARLTIRLSRIMVLAIVIAIAFSVSFASWRVTTGLLLGGLLSLLNFYWLRTSVDAAFNQAGKGTRPKIRVAQYVLRYFIVGSLVYAGYRTDFVSLTATMVGLSSFVVALFSEALRETYFIITRREGIH